jgi:alginate O-acetyltransferase complex protein AlgJ
MSATTRTITTLHAALFAMLVLLTSGLALQRAGLFSGGFKVGPDDQAILEGRYARALESHYDAAFPARTFGINLWAAIDYLVFAEGHDGVVVGSQDWLYTDEEFRLENGAADTAADNLAELVDVRDRLAQRGIQLVLAVIPSKARVYPEFLGGRQPPAMRQLAYAELLAAARTAGIPEAALLEPLIAGKAEGATYLRTDTHWTPRGAQIAAAAIAGAVHTLALPPVAPTAYRTTTAALISHHGDLLSFLPLDPYFSWLLPRPDQLQPTHTEAADAGGDLFAAAAAPRIALVGTSYSGNPLWDFPGALELALHEPIANYAMNGVGPFAPMRAYLASADFKTAPPQLVIWEFPERYLTITAHVNPNAAAPSKAP